MQTFCTDTILVLRSSWRGSYRTSWPKQTPSLHPLLPPQCWPKEKSGREIVPKWLSITDKGNVSSDYPTLSSDQMGSDFSVLKSCEMASLTEAGLWGSPHPKPSVPSVQRRSAAVVTPFHISRAKRPAPRPARGRGTEVYWDANVLQPLLRLTTECERPKSEWGPRMEHWKLAWWIWKGIF